MKRREKLVTELRKGETCSGIFRRYVKQGDVHFKQRRTNVETQEDIISFPAYYGKITIKVSSLQCGLKCLFTTIVYD